MTWRARHTGTIAAMNIQRARALALRSDPADPAGAWAVLQTSGRRKQNRPSNSCNPLSTSGIDILGLHFREVSKGRLGRLRRHRVQSCPVSSFADSILFIKLKRFLARTHTHFPLFVSHGKVDGCLPACLPASQPWQRALPLGPCPEPARRLIFGNALRSECGAVASSGCRLGPVTDPPLTCSIRDCSASKHHPSYSVRARPEAGAHLFA
ncbi:hypothetical protein MPTK2_4g19660 [Marchantia polymorpha subsp. ruderalis]